MILRKVAFVFMQQPCNGKALIIIHSSVLSFPFSVSERFLFPFDGSAGLGSEVIEHTVDIFDLRGDAFGDVLEQCKGNVLHRGGHCVGGVDGTDDDGISECALAVLYADRFEIRHSGEVLPDLAFQTVFGKFLTENGVGFPDSLEAVTGDSAEAADTESGPREGLTVDHVVGQTESLAQA